MASNLLGDDVITKCLWQKVHPRGINPEVDSGLLINASAWMTSLQSLFTTGAAGTDSCELKGSLQRRFLSTARQQMKNKRAEQNLWIQGLCRRSRSSHFVSLSLEIRKSVRKVGRTFLTPMNISFHLLVTWAITEQVWCASNIRGKKGRLQSCPLYETERSKVHRTRKGDNSWRISNSLELLGISSQ
jgi:hypothetical protein